MYRVRVTEVTATDVTVVRAWDARAHRFSPSTPLPLSQRVGDEGKKKKRKKGFDFRNDKAATRVGKTGRDYGRSVTVAHFFFFFFCFARFALV